MQKGLLVAWDLLSIVTFVKMLGLIVNVHITLKEVYIEGLYQINLKLPKNVLFKQCFYSKPSSSISVVMPQDFTVASGSVSYHQLKYE